jgi:hypothetical protein
VGGGARADAQAIAPPLAAQDRVDAQVLVDGIDEERQTGLLSAVGFRCRAEPPSVGACRGERP